jgi:hypothetical protein
VWSGLRLKSAVVEVSLVIFTVLVCGAQPSFATISVSGLLRASSQNAYRPFPVVSEAMAVQACVPGS